MIKRRILLGSLLAIAAALPVVTPGRADARVFFGVGIGFPAIGFGFPYVGFGYPYYGAGFPYYMPYYRPYYAPPAYAYPPPLGYVPPAAYGAPATGDAGPSAIARCVSRTVICPLRYVEPVGTACSCPGKTGGRVAGMAG